MEFKIKRKYLINSNLVHLANYIYYRFFCRLKKQDLVSVIIACKDAEGTIKNTLKSLEKQTYCNIEIILVDDGSLDNSVKVIEQYKLTSNMKIILKKLSLNLGSANARNVGMKLANGHYICFNDADDISHKRRIEFQVKALQENKNKIFSECLYYRTYNDKKIKVNYRRYLICIISIMFERQKVLKNLGGMANLSLGEDSEFRERMIAFYGVNSEKIVFLPLYSANFTAKSSFFSKVNEIKIKSGNVSYKISPENNEELEYYRNNWHKKILLEGVSANINNKPYL